MACFVVPMAEAIVITAVKKFIKKQKLKDKKTTQTGLT